MLSTSMANRFARFRDLHNYDLSTVQKLFTGGATMKQEAQDALRKHLPNTLVTQAYGKICNEKVKNIILKNQFFYINIYLYKHLRNNYILIM